MFQAADFCKENIRRIAVEINELTDVHKSLATLDKVFESAWQELQSVYQSALQEVGIPTEKTVDPNEALKKLLSLTTDISFQVNAIEKVSSADIFRKITEVLDRAIARPIDDRFYERTETHRNIVHHIRDICVTQMPNGIAYRSPACKKKEPPQPHVELERRRGEVVGLLTSVSKLFDRVLPPDTRVWAALRDIRCDGALHTFARGGEYSTNRPDRTSPVPKDKSKVIERLKESVDIGKPAILTGSVAGPEEWERQSNDELGEDKCIMMAAVLAKSYKKGHSSSSFFPWVLSVNANKVEIFSEQHLPLMICCTELFSILLNVILRHQHLPANGNGKGKRK